MLNPTTITAAAASLLLCQTALAQGGLYTKNSPVLQVDGKSYDSLIARSNHTSIVEFYAPWCGHCKNLQPAYEKAAKSLDGLAKVAAINCDEETNKPFCGSMGVQGFPTLKIIRPGKKAGRPNVEDYQGARTAKGIVDAVKNAIPNHVKKLTDKSLDEWLGKSKETPKAILFSDKGTTSALIKALAVDYLGSMEIAQIRNKEEAASERFSITSYPTLVLLPGGDKEPITYSGELKKQEITKFFAQVATPNPDPAPKKPKAPKSATKDSKKAAKDSSAFSSASKSHASADSSSAKATQTSETLEEASNPTESPNPNVVDSDSQKPIKIPDVPPMIPSLSIPEALQQACLTPKSGTCVLALLPAGTDPSPETLAQQPLASAALTSLSQIQQKHTQRGGKLFPFYTVPGTNSEAANLREKLSLGAETEMYVFATNAKKGWVKRYEGIMGRDEIESWVDGLRMGEGKKEKLPAGLIVEKVAAAAAAEKVEEPKLKVEDVKDMSDEEVERIVKQAMDAAKGKGESTPEHEEL